MKTIFYSLVIFLFSSFYGFSQESKILNDVQEKFNSVSAMSADFVQSANGKSSVTGKVFYGKGDKFRVELKNNIIVCDGETFWNYNKKENKVIVNNYDADDPSSFSIKTILNDYPQKCTIEEKEGAVILTPKKDSGLNFTKAEIWVNDQNLVQKVLLEDPSKGNIEVSLSNYNLNQKVSENKFKYNPPEGSKVIDLR